MVRRAAEIREAARARGKEIEAESRARAEEEATLRRRRFAGIAAELADGVQVRWFGLDESIAARLGELQEQDVRAQDAYTPPPAGPLDGLLAPIAQPLGLTSAVNFLSDTFLPVWAWVKWPVVVLILLVLIATLYYTTPNVQKPRFHLFGPGNIVALVGMVLAAVALSVYFTQFAGYSAYGAIGTIMALLFALWIFNIVLLLGLEVDAEVERARQLEAGLPAEAELRQRSLTVVAGWRAIDSGGLALDVLGGLRAGPATEAGILLASPSETTLIVLTTVNAAVQRVPARDQVAAQALTPRDTAIIELERRAYLSGAALERIAGAEPTEAELRAAYDEAKRLSGFTTKQVSEVG